MSICFLSLSDLEMMFPSAPASSITVVTVTHRQSSSEEVAQPDSDQLLNTVSLP